MTVLTRPWFERPVLDVARALLGMHLVRTTTEGTIVLRLTEVEAYAGADDPGSHAFRGETKRNAVMFGPAGHAYVYFTYGMHHCVNVVTGLTGHSSGVLMRAGEVVEGESLVRARRGEAVPYRDLARGPARLTVALDIDLRLNGVDLTQPGALLLAAGTPVDDARVRTGPRVGVSGEGGVRPWRFWVDGEPSVSPYRASVPRRKA
ncbi:DNA-3-methyladenine glycosylase [Acidothermaceae bacterium B102]|nr:DNA-3-methyladenine glycosylase [Acidothermaceae bacterium B102]